MIMNINQKAYSAIIIDADQSSVGIMKSILASKWEFTTHTTTDDRSAWELIVGMEPELLLIAHAPPKFDAPKLTKALRRSDVAARKTPVIMLAHNPLASEIKAARDAGVHEVLCKPFKVMDLTLRVDAVMKKQRGWVEAIAYVGPDRRRFNSVELAAQRRRRIDKETLSPEKARIDQALKIMKAAIEAIDSEPQQAMRALRAQADEIQDAAVTMADFALAGAAQALRACLETAVNANRFNRRQFASDINGLFALPLAPLAAQKPIWWVS
jgi:DNA-binding response OmpR family regulator